MKTKFKLVVFVFSLLLLVSFSCKKVTDDIDPIINIFLPYENEIINIPDTMHIEAKVSDDNKIEQIQIVITDENFIPAFGSYEYPVNENPATINDDMIIDDIHINSGIYYLKIRAYDGTNYKNAFRKIYINEIPRELNDIIVITKNTGRIDIQSIDKSFKLNHLFDVDGTFEKSEINPFEQLLYIAGKYYDNLKAFDLEKKEQEWVVEGLNYPPLPYFRNIYYDNELLYISTSKGEIRSYNNTLTNITTSVMKIGYVPGICCKHEEYLLSEGNEISGDHTYLFCYYAISGSLANELLVDMDITGIFPKEENKFYVLGNKQNEGGIYVYHINNNGIEKIKTFNGKSIILSEQIDENNLFIAFDDGVYHYNYNQNSLTSFAANLSVIAMEYDDIGKVLYVAEKIKVSSFKYPQWNVADFIDVPKEILNMHLHYNK